jgi:hypothetical protein
MEGVYYGTNFQKELKLIIIIIIGYQCSQLHSIFSFQGQVHTQTKLFVINSMGFDVTAQLLIRFSVFIKQWRKNGNTMREYIIYS